jgi:uncharacterized protein (DUF3084 family)
MQTFRRFIAAVRGRPRTVAVTAIVIVLVSGLAADQLIRARLRDTRVQTSEARGARDNARIELGGARGDLLFTRTRLATVTERRDQLREQRIAARRQLARVEGRTTTAIDEILLNAAQIETLTHCLNLASSALNQSAVADEGAHATLAAAQRVCLAAVAEPATRRGQQ